MAARGVADSILEVDSGNVEATTALADLAKGVLGSSTSIMAPAVVPIAGSRSSLLAQPNPEIYSGWDG